MVRRSLGFVVLVAFTALQVGCGCGSDVLPSVAGPQAFRTVGNVLLDVDAANGVLAGAASSGGAPLSLLSFDATSRMGGDVIVFPDGGFLYDPPVGFEGVDGFEVVLTDGTRNTTRSVSVTVVEMVWFIDGSEPPGGDGRFTAPLDETPAFNALQQAGGPSDPEPGDYVFVYEDGGAPYDGGIRLLADQHLIGNGVDLVVDSTLIVPAAGRPVLTNTFADAFTDGNGVVLADGTEVLGLDIDGTSLHGIAGVPPVGALGPIFVDEVTISDTTRNGIEIAAREGTYTFGPDTLVTSAGGIGVRVFGNVFPAVATYEYQGDVDGAGEEIVDISFISEGSSVTFSGGSINQTGGGGLRFALCTGAVTFTSPSSLTGLSFSDGINARSCWGLTIANATVTGVLAPGLDGVELNLGSVELTDLQVATVGTASAFEARALHELYVDRFGGNSSIEQTGGRAVRIQGRSDSSSGVARVPSQLDVTFQTVTSVDPDDDAVRLQDVAGSFTVEGTTAVSNGLARGIVVLNHEAALEFSRVEIDGTNLHGIYIDDEQGSEYFGSTGSFTVPGDGATLGSGGFVTNTGLVGLVPAVLARVSNVSLAYIDISGTAGRDAVVADALTGLEFFHVVPLDFAMDNATVTGDTGGIRLRHTGTTNAITGTITNSTIVANGPGLAADHTGPGSGSMVLCLDNLNVSSTGQTAILLDGSPPAGLPRRLTITCFRDLTVPAASSGGIVVNHADLDAGGGAEVPGGTFNIGSPAQRVSGDGMAFTRPQGSLEIPILNIYNQAPSNSGLFVDTKGFPPLVFSFTVIGGTIDTVGGPGVFVDPLSVDMTFDRIVSTGSRAGQGWWKGTGAVFDRVEGVFRVRSLIVDDSASHPILVTDSPDLVLEAERAVVRDADGAPSARGLHVVRSDGAVIDIDFVRETCPDGDGKSGVPRAPAPDEE